MNNEEEIAIECLKNRLKILHNNTQWATEESIRIVLNLIDKQQKEIEKLKQEMEERLIGREEITKYEMGYEIENNYISKDKIRDKQKELEVMLRTYIENSKKDIYYNSEYVNSIEMSIKTLEELLDELEDNSLNKSNNDLNDLNDLQIIKIIGVKDE